MKRIVFVCVAAVLMLSVSCSKEGPERFEGSWSFKTSGSLTVALKDSEGNVTGVSPVSFVTEAGQMHVVRKDSDDEMLVTMNVIGGDVVAYQAVASGNELSLMASARRLSLNLGDMTVIHPIVSAEGSGKRYDDVLLIEFHYSGSIKVGNITYEIIGSDVECVAVQNE